MPLWTCMVARQNLVSSRNVTWKHPKVGDIEEPSAVSTSVMGGGQEAAPLDVKCFFLVTQIRSFCQSAFSLPEVGDVWVDAVSQQAASSAH